MKRGLVVLDESELPDSEWRDRLDRVRKELAATGVDVALAYGDVFRSDDIAYLTNLCIYWNEGILAIPVAASAGEPAFLTKLSPRVHPWMRRTSTLTDLRSGKSFGALITALLADREPGTLGLVEGNLWPAAVVEEVTAAAAGWTVRPLDGVVRALRTRPSEREVTLLKRAGAALSEALTAATADGLTDQERVSVAERIVRDAGFTDVVVRAEHPAVEITGQYRNSWLRAARGGPDADAALRAAVAAVSDGVAVSELAKAAGQWQVRVFDHADLSTNGEYTTAPPTRRLATGEVVVISVETAERIGASETVLVGASGAEPLTAQEVLA